MREHGHDRPVTFSRAGFTGSQGLPAHWAGDEDSTWEAYRASLVAGLSSGASGVAFWGWDIAGFSGELPTAELYKRAVAMAAFCPIMQYHSEHNEHRSPLADRTPWNVAEHRDDPEVLQTYAFYARLRMNLIPYLFGLGHEAARSGLPLMRALALEFPDDQVAAAVDDQFLLGPDLLVAPVLEPGLVERRVYLPEGDWHELWSGSAIASGWTAVPTPAGELPVYLRGGACLPLWMPTAEAPLGASVGLPAEGTGHLVLMLTPGTCRTRLVDPLTGTVWSVDVQLLDGALNVRASDAPEGVTLWLRGSGPEQHIQLRAGESNLSITLGVA
jgi:alpha-glucosidase (family GH31 glycosyl hydrolase)